MVNSLVHSWPSSFLAQHLMSVPNNSRSTLFSFVTTAGLSPLQLQLENKCHLTKYALKLQMNVQKNTVTGSRACFIKSLPKSTKGEGQKANKAHICDFSRVHRELATH